MYGIIFGVVLTWNWFLQAIGRFLGQMTGGLVLGYIRGIKDLEKMQMWFKYRAAEAALKNKEGL